MSKGHGRQYFWHIVINPQTFCGGSLYSSRKWTKLSFQNISSKRFDLCGHHPDCFPGGCICINIVITWPSPYKSSIVFCQNLRWIAQKLLLLNMLCERLSQMKDSSRGLACIFPLQPTWNLNLQEKRSWKVLGVAATLGICFGSHDEDRKDIYNDKCMEKDEGKNRQRQSNAFSVELTQPFPFFAI